MAATIEVPVSRPARPQRRRFPAPAAVGVALVLAVTAALIVIAIWRGLASAPAGRLTGTLAVVSHLAPGPPGS
jgi:ferric-dicitrate binding protein FerR (iron transport regulator)